MLGTFVDVFPPFLYVMMNIVHDQYFHYKLHIFVIFIFYLSCQASYMYNWYWFIPRVAWSSLTIMPVPLGVEKVASNGENLLHVSCSDRVFAYWAGIWGEGYVFRLSLCSDICMSVYTSASTFIYPSVCLHICWCVHTSVSTILSNILYLHSYQIARD